MPEQTSQNAKAFDPASFSMPAQPSLTYSVIANTNQPELSSYVQTVFHRMQGTNNPVVRLSDQSPPTIRTTQGTQSYGAQANFAAQQPPVPAMIYRGSNYQQRSSVQFSLSDRTTESKEATSYRPNQHQSFAPPADRSNLPYYQRVDVVPRLKAGSSAAVLNASRKKILEKKQQSQIAKESRVVTSKTKLVALRKDSALTEKPQRDQNTIAKKPEEFLKREPFSNKFTVTPSAEREVGKTKSTGKTIYLKSVPPAGHTAKLKVPKFVQEKAPEPIAETAVAPAKTPVVQTPQPQFIRWPLVNSAQDQVLFPAPVLTVSPKPMEVDFVSATPSVEAETTKIDFAEVHAETAVEPATDQSTMAAFDPFEDNEAPDAPFQSSPFESSDQSSLEQSSLEQASPFETSLESSSPFEDSPEPSSPFQDSSASSSPFEDSPEPSSPFEDSPVNTTPEESSPFQSSPFESAPEQTTPDPSSPFQSSPFRSSPTSSLFKSESDGALSGSFAAPMKDFSVPAPPVATVCLAGDTRDNVSDLEVSQVKNNSTPEAPSERSDIGSPKSESSLKTHDGPFKVIGHRPMKLSRDSAPITNKFKNTDSQTESSKIILPEFKPSLNTRDGDQYLTASTLQSGHRSDAGVDHQFETPWLSPWWMLIGLIPIALYLGTMKLFRDEDEYHSHKNELFGSRVEFTSDFGELGRSKSDDFYGRQDRVATVQGPSGEEVRLDVGTSQSPAQFAESLQFELPSSKEVAQSSFGQELRIDQSPNFSNSAKPKTGLKKKKQRNGGKKRNKR